MATKKYYWIKLSKDFFQQREMKKLRRIAGGDTYTIIYLKMLLLSADNDGYIRFDENLKFVEELAVEIDEDENNVAVCLSFLVVNKLVQETNIGERFMTKLSDMVGAESDSAKRVRKHRESQKTLQCNVDVTASNADVISCNENVTTEYRDRVRDKSIELDKDVVVVNTKARSIEQDKVQEDNRSSSIISLFENNIHPISGQIEAEMLVSLLEECGESNVEYAIKEAIRRNARNLSFIAKVAESRKNGYTKPSSSSKSVGGGNLQEAFDSLYGDKGGNGNAN